MPSQCLFLPCKCNCRKNGGNFQNLMGVSVPHARFQIGLVSISFAWGVEHFHLLFSNCKCIYVKQTGPQLCKQLNWDLPNKCQGQVKIKTCLPDSNYIIESRQGMNIELMLISAGVTCSGTVMFLTHISSLRTHISKFITYGIKTLYYLYMLGLSYNLSTLIY